MYPQKLTPTYCLIEKEQHQPTKRLKLPNMYIYTYIYKYIYMHHIYIYNYEQLYEILQKHEPLNIPQEPPFVRLYKMRHARVVVGQPDLRWGDGEGGLRRGDQHIAAGTDVCGAAPDGALDGAKHGDRQVADAIQELYKGILTWDTSYDSYDIRIYKDIYVYYHI